MKKQPTPIESLQAAVSAALRAGLPADVAEQLEQAARRVISPAQDWIRHTEAAAILRRRPDALTEKDIEGGYRLYPHLTRIRREGEKFVYMLRSEVLEQVTKETRAAMACVHRHASEPSVDAADVARYGIKTARVLAGLSR